MSTVLFLLTSCGNEDIPQKPEREIAKSENAMTRSVKTYPVLSFENQSAFDEAVNEIASLDSSEAELAWVKENYPEFESIQHVYSQALSEAENLDETEEAFTAFMDKYDALYFPLVGEDAGFYIPMSNLDAAFLVNPNCEVKIGGEIVNLKDISDYCQLFSLGRTYYNEGTPLLADTYTEFTFKPSMTKIGQTYESGWRYNADNDRKINLKIDRQLNEISPAPTYTVSESKLHIKVSFRKHMNDVVGWVNYSSKTTVVGSFKCGSEVISVNKDMSGTSSHDVKLYIPVHIELGNGNFYVATFPEITSDNLVVHFRGFDNRKPYNNIKMNGAYCKIPYLGMIVPRF